MKDTPIHLMPNNNYNPTEVFETYLKRPLAIYIGIFIQPTKILWMNTGFAVCLHGKPVPLLDCEFCGRISLTPGNATVRLVRDGFHKFCTGLSGCTICNHRQGRTSHTPLIWPGFPWCGSCGYFVVLLHFRFGDGSLRKYSIDSISVGPQIPFSRRQNTVLGDLFNFRCGSFRILPSACDRCRKEG